MRICTTINENQEGIIEVANSIGIAPEDYIAGLIRKALKDKNVDVVGVSISHDEKIDNKSKTVISKDSGNISSMMAEFEDLMYDYGISQSDVACALNSTQSTISRSLKSKRWNIIYDTLIKESMEKVLIKSYYASAGSELTPDDLELCGINKELFTFFKAVSNVSLNRLGTSFSYSVFKDILHNFYEDKKEDYQFLLDNKDKLETDVGFFIETVNKIYYTISTKYNF